VTIAHRFRRAIASRFASKPFALQRLRWPKPWRPPYLEPEITLYRPGELGDVVMCLAVVRAIRERNPAARIRFITNFHELLRGHPLLDEVLPSDALRTGRFPNLVSPRYEVFIPPTRHLIDYLGGSAGLRTVEHTIPLPDFRGELADIVTKLPPGRPRIAVVRRAGFFTPNKDWPNDRWVTLIRRLAEAATVIDLGTEAAEPALAPNHLDLRGQTNVRQYCALIHGADLVISPPTSATHIAAAYGVPSVSIVGGYEAPANTFYRGNIQLTGNVPCAPCWRQEECPINRACLAQISVEQVLAAARTLLRGRSETHQP
jgi:ADP-heptose:LPS heptosyltransferase